MSPPWPSERVATLPPQAEPVARPTPGQTSKAGSRPRPTWPATLVAGALLVASVGLHIGAMFPAYPGNPATPVVDIPYETAVYICLEVGWALAALAVLTRWSPRGGVALGAGLGAVEVGLIVTDLTIGFQVSDGSAAGIWFAIAGLAAGLGGVLYGAGATPPGANDARTAEEELFSKFSKRDSQPAYPAPASPAGTYPGPASPPAYPGPASPAAYHGPASPAGTYPGPASPAGTYPGPASPPAYPGPASQSAYPGPASPAAYPKPRPAVISPVRALLSVMVAIVAVAAFWPSWDHYHLVYATGQVRDINLGNAFNQPAAIMAGELVAGLAIGCTIVTAAFWRDAVVGAWAIAGTAIALASQVISGIVQVSEPISKLLGTPSTSAVNLSASSVSLTGYWYVDLGATAALFLLAFWAGFEARRVRPKPAPAANENVAAAHPQP